MDGPALAGGGSERKPNAKGLASGRRAHGHFGHVQGAAGRGASQNPDHPVPGAPLGVGHGPGQAFRGRAPGLGRQHARSTLARPVSDIAPEKTVFSAHGFRKSVRRLHTAPQEGAEPRVLQEDGRHHESAGARPGSLRHSGRKKRPSADGPAGGREPLSKRGTLRTSGRNRRGSSGRHPKDSGLFHRKDIFRSQGVGKVC